MFDKRQYNDAAKAFDALGSYLDSEKRKVDCEFLMDIKASILNRREQNARNTSYRILTDTELAYIEKYNSLQFSDKQLKNYAAKYITGLREQKEALSMDTNSSGYQIAWKTGYVIRSEVLSKLYQEYGLLADDKEFIATYVSSLQKEKDELSALKTIDSDIHKQLDGVTFTEVDDYHFRAKYKNNTQYTFDVTFYFTFYKIKEKDLKKYSDEELFQHGNRVGESTNSFKNIRSNSSNKLKFYCPIKLKNWNVCNFNWTISNIIDG